MGLANGPPDAPWNPNPGEVTGGGGAAAAAKALEGGDMGVGPHVEEPPPRRDGASRLPEDVEPPAPTPPRPWVDLEAPPRPVGDPGAKDPSPLLVDRPARPQPSVRYSAPLL